MATRDDVIPELRELFDSLTAQQQADALAEIDARNASHANLGNVVPTLRTWGDDADAAVAAWDGWTTAQRFAANKTVIQRFGTLCDRFADLLVAQGKA